jgi:anti-sigma factor RsiW
LADWFQAFSHREGINAMAKTMTAAPAARSVDATDKQIRREGPGWIPRPATAPAYYLGRPASVWIAAFGRAKLRTEP